MKYNILFLTTFSLLLLNSCEENEVPISAVVSTSSQEIETTTQDLERTYTTMNIKGKIESIDNQGIMEKGLCWGLTPEPSTDNSVALESENIFESEITGLMADTDYYFRVFVTTETGTTYSEGKMFSTLSLEGTSWQFATDYSNDFTIYSKVDLRSDYTTVYDELDLPLHCPGCFITHGTWSLYGNNIVYIWEGSDSDNSTYTYYGTLSGMEMTGTYEHVTLADNNWSATIYE